MGNSSTLKLNAVSLKSESELKTENIVRFDDDSGESFATHFATFLFFNRSGVLVVFSKNGEEGGISFERIPDLADAYGTVTPLPKTDKINDKTGYYNNRP